jgi:hypothetical protein
LGDVLSFIARRAVDPCGWNVNFRRQAPHCGMCAEGLLSID